MSKSEGKETYPERHEWLDAVHRCAHLHPKTKNIGWALYSHADKESLFCWPNLDHLSADLGGAKSSKNVSGHIRALERAGFVIVGSLMLQGRLSNNYTLVHPPVVCGVHHVDLDKDWVYESPAALDPEPSALDLEPTAPAPEPSHLEEQGLTLPITPAPNTVLDTSMKKPSASEIQEEIMKMGDTFFSSGSVGSSDSDTRQWAASPPQAETENEDLVSLMDSLFDTPARQNAASPHVAAIEERVSVGVHEIPNEEW